MLILDDGAHKCDCCSNNAVTTIYSMNTGNGIALCLDHLETLKDMLDDRLSELEGDE